MMCIDTSPGAYAMQMADKHARTRRGTYTMGVFDTWRASEAADIDRPFRTARITSEDVDAGPTTNAPNRLKHPAQQLRVCARSTIYHTHTVIDSTAAAMCSHMLACRKTYPQFPQFFFFHEGCWRKDQGFLTLVTWRLRMWTRK